MALVEPEQMRVFRGRAAVSSEAQQAGAALRQLAETLADLPPEQIDVLMKIARALQRDE